MTLTLTNNGVKNGGEIFNGIWWRVRLPDGWSGSQDKECATFLARIPLGALQISSARKDSGRVTDRELKKLAKERVPADIRITRVVPGSFSGFSAEYVKGDSFWKEWWLRLGQLMVYVTYNGPHGKEGFEREDVQRILASLDPIL